MQQIIDARKIETFLNSKNIEPATKDAYRSVLGNLEVFANNFEEKPLGEILSLFLNQDLKPKARIFYNSVSSQYLNYIEKMQKIGDIEPTVKPVRPIEQVKPREQKQKPVFVGQEIDFSKLIKFDDSAFFVNKCEPYHAIGDEVEKAELAILSGRNFCIRGKAGTGKTSLGVYLAHKHNMPVVKIACNDGVKDYHLIGSKSVDENDQVKFEAGLLMQAVLLANKYGKCEVILDEANTLKSTTMKVLNPFMDETRFINVNGYGKLELIEGAQLFFYLTMNLNYAGTNDLNTEFKGRTTMTEIKSVPREMQKAILSRYNVRSDIIDKIIDMTEKINYQQSINEIDPLTVFSTREQLTALSMIEAGIDSGMDEKKAVKLALSVNFTEKVYEERQQRQIERIISGVFEG